jgi:putative membrane protein
MAMWWWHDSAGWGWLAMTLTMIVIWGLVIWVVMGLVGTGRRSGRDISDPEVVLARRFAAGEIDEDEYRRRLAVLRDRSPSPR